MSKKLITKTSTVTFCPNRMTKKVQLTIRPQYRMMSTGVDREVNDIFVRNGYLVQGAPTKEVSNWSMRIRCAIIGTIH